MRTSSETVHLEMEFSDRMMAQPLLRKLMSIPDLILNIVRGRVTPVDARLELEVTGTSSQVARAVRLSREWGIAVRMVPGGA